MAEVLSELVAKIKADSTELKSGLSQAEKAVDKAGSGIQSKVESIKKSINGISTAWAGVGAAIIGGMGLVAKSAMDAVESENLFTASLGANAKVAREWSNELSKALGLNAYELRKNTGTFYVMLESMGMTNDEALVMSERMTELAYDMASFYNLRPEEAFEKIKSGIVGMPRPLQDLGIVINETAIETYALKTGLIEQGQEMTNQQKITARYGALLEATTIAQGDLARTMDSPVNKMRILGSAIDEVKIIIGENLLPAIGNMLNSFTGIIAKIKEWVTANPQLVKAIMAGAVAVAAIITTVMALKVALILLGTTANLMFGGILILIGALVTGGVLLAQNWDKVSHFFADIWSNMKNAVLHAVDAMLGYLEKFMGWIPIIGDKIRDARESIAGMIDRERISRDIRDLKRDLEGLTQTVKEEFEKQASEIQTSYDIQRAESQKAYDAAVEAINKEYGIGEAAKEVSETRIEAARRATEEIKESYEREKDAAKDRYDSEMQQVKDLYNERLSKLNIETDDKVRALQEQIEAIDRQTEAEELAIQRIEEAEKLANLEMAYAAAETAEDKAKAKEEWEEYAAEVARKELLRTRKGEKDALRDQITEARERAAEKRERIKEEEEAALASLQTKYKAEIKHYNDLAIAADEDLAFRLELLERDRLAKIEAEEIKLDVELTRLADAEKAEVEFMANQLAATKEHINDINVAYDDLQRKYTVTITTQHISTYATTGASSTRGTTTGASSLFGITPGSRETWRGWAQEGGIFTKPSIIGVGEAGAEAVIPLDKAMGNVVINFTQPVFFDREDTMNRFVDKISKTLDRKYRLGGRL